MFLSSSCCFFPPFFLFSSSSSLLFFSPCLFFSLPALLLFCVILLPPSRVMFEVTSTSFSRYRRLTSSLLSFYLSSFPSPSFLCLTSLLFFLSSFVLAVSSLFLSYRSSSRISHSLCFMFSCSVLLFCLSLSLSCLLSPYSSLSCSQYPFDSLLSLFPLSNPGAAGTDVARLAEPQLCHPRCPACTFHKSFAFPLLHSPVKYPWSHYVSVLRINQDCTTALCYALEATHVALGMDGQ